MDPEKQPKHDVISTPQESNIVTDVITIKQHQTTPESLNEMDSDDDHTDIINKHANSAASSNETHYCDYFAIGILSGILGASIGIGETSWHTSFREVLFVAGLIGLMALPFLLYYAYKRCQNQHTNDSRVKNAAYYLKLLSSAFFCLLLSYGIMQRMNTIGRMDSYFDQQHSRSVSNWASKVFHSDQLKFQVLSYQFGYMLPAGLLVLFIACAYYRKKDMSHTEKRTLCQLRKDDWLEMLFHGSLIAGLALGLNSGLQKLGVGVSQSLRPIVGTDWQYLPLPTNTYANISGLGQVKNAGFDPLKNWYSGHVAFVATLFWLSCLYVRIAYQKHTAKVNDDSYWPFFKSNYGKVLLCLGFLITALITASLRVFGDAHSISAVIGGFIIPLFTVLLAVGFYNCILGAYNYLSQRKIAFSSGGALEDDVNVTKNVTKQQTLLDDETDKQVLCQ
jgi:membrane-associated phospholipid phosphatase